MEQWGGTGIIARIMTPRLARAIAATGLPTIVLDLPEEQSAANSPLAGFSELVTTPTPPRDMAAEHLLDKGSNTTPSWARREGLVRSARRAFLRADYRGPASRPHVYHAVAAEAERRWAAEQKSLAEWLQHSPSRSG